MAGEYSGRLLLGRPHGQGQLTCDSGDVITGQFADGLPHGLAKRTFADGSTYEGHWERGSMSGAGTLLQPNGDKYDGMWFRGLRSSSGIQTWARAPTAPGTATVKYTPVCCPCCRRSACRARSRLRLRQISRSQPPLGTPGSGQRI